MHLQRNREPNVGSRFRLRGELPVGNEQTRGLRAVEVFALEDMDEDMTGRDSNRGACAQPCRYQYALMEEKRPGEYFPVFEDPGPC